MPPRTPKVVVKVDPKKTAWDQPHTVLHNRWHPDIPSVRMLAPMTQLLASIVAHCTAAHMRRPCAVMAVAHACTRWLVKAAVTAGCCRAGSCAPMRHAGGIRERGRALPCGDRGVGGQIKDSDSSDDIKHVDLCQVCIVCNSKCLVHSPVAEIPLRQTLAVAPWVGRCKAVLTAPGAHPLRPAALPERAH